MRYFVYILQSLKDKKFYVGMTTNLEKRLTYHNKGFVKSTKYRVPLKMIYTECFGDRQTARDREKYLKSYKGSREKLTILENL